MTQITEEIWELESRGQGLRPAYGLQAYPL